MKEETTQKNNITILEVAHALLASNNHLATTNYVNNIELKRAIILGTSHLHTAIIDNAQYIEELPVYNDDPNFKIYHMTRTSFQTMLTEAADWLMIAACTSDLTTLAAEVTLCIKSINEIVSNLLGQK